MSCALGQFSECGRQLRVLWAAGALLSPSRWLAAGVGVQSGCWVFQHGVGPSVIQPERLPPSRRG